MRIPLLAAVVMALAAFTAQTTAAIDWASLDYFEYGPAEFKQPLNSKWRNTKLVANIPFGDYPIINSNSPQVVWAPICKAGKQVAEFKKTVTLPGKPARLEGSAGAYLDGSTSVGARIEVFVNGTPILSTDSETHKRVLGGRGAFHLGKNRVKVRATKPANVSCSSTFGVYVFLYAKFRADVAFSMQPPPKGVQLQPKFDYRMTINNRGPSAIPAGYGGGVYFSVSSKNVFLWPGTTNGLIVTGIDTENCVFIGQHNTGPAMTCLLSRDLGPGGSQTVTISFYYDAPGDIENPVDFKDTFTVQWQATGYQDPTPNPLKGETRTVCTTDPVTKKCKLG